MPPICNVQQFISLYNDISVHVLHSHDQCQRQRHGCKQSLEFNHTLTTPLLFSLHGSNLRPSCCLNILATVISSTSEALHLSG